MQCNVKTMSAWYLVSAEKNAFGTHQISLPMLLLPRGWSWMLEWQKPTTLPIVKAFLRERRKCPSQHYRFSYSHLEFPCLGRWYHFNSRCQHTFMIHSWIQKKLVLIWPLATHCMKHPDLSSYMHICCSRRNISCTAAMRNANSTVRDVHLDGGWTVLFL